MPNYLDGAGIKREAVGVFNVDPANSTEPPLGRAAAVASKPVVLSNEDFARLGQIVTGGSTSTVVNVPAATGSTLIKASNTARLGLTIANDSTAIMYVLQGPGAPSATNYSFAIPAKATIAADRTITGYTGEVRAVWAAVNGFAMVTEVS